MTAVNSPDGDFVPTEEKRFSSKDGDVQMASASWSRTSERGRDTHVSRVRQPSHA